MSNTVTTPAATTDATETIQHTEFTQDVHQHLKAGYQILYVHTSEESRAEAELHRLAQRMDWGVITWDSACGFTAPAALEKKLSEPKYNNPIQALGAVADKSLISGDLMLVFRDLDDYMKDPTVRRHIKSLEQGNHLVNSKRHTPIIIISSQLNIPDKIKSSITVIDFVLPDEEALLQTVDFVQTSVKGKAAGKATLSPELRRNLATNMLGLTHGEAENCLSRCLIIHDGFKDAMLDTIKDEKAGIIKKEGILTYIPVDSVASFSDIGGYENYTTWLARRKLAYGDEARQLQIDYPKGCVLLGLPGTGKSMVAKATCHAMDLPGYILDIGSLFGSLVGESEKRTRDVLRQIDAQRGCVLVIDEADKALGNAVGSRGDSGVTQRVFGTILTWLAENRSKTFCIMTLNRTEGLPPELLRAGRFDKIFFTDIPADAERRQIMEIHLRRRGVDPASLGFDDADWEQLIKDTDGYVGAELEEVIVDARGRALEATAGTEGVTGTPTFDQLRDAIKSVIPLTVHDPAGMKEIREFCENKGEPVSAAQNEGQTKKQKRLNRQKRNVDLDE